MLPPLVADEDLRESSALTFTAGVAVGAVVAIVLLFGVVAVVSVLGGGS